MLKHLMNHWKTHRQKSPYVVSDDPFCCTDLSLGGSPDKNIYSVNRVNPIYQNSDSEESSSKSGNCRVKSDLKDVYKPQCSTCGFYPSTLSYPITRTLGDIYAPPSLLSSEIYQPFMEKKTSGEDGRDVSLRPQFNRRLTNNTKVADKVVPFLYDSQFQNSYGDFRTKRKRNIIDFHGPVSSETEDSGIQVGNSCASSLENEETAETGGVRYSLQSYNKNGISLIEPVICLKHDHLSVSKRVRKGHERNLSFSQPCVVRVKEQQMNSSSRKAKEQPDTFNETLDSGSREEQMKTYKDREEDTENVLDVDESLESEAAFATKNKDFNESQQFLNDVEKSTNQIKETPEFKAHKNSVISSESQLEFTSCNSELPHNPSVKGPKSPFSTRTSWHVCDQDGIGHLKQIPKITEPDRLVQVQNLSPMKRECNRGSRTSEKTVSILKSAPNNSSSSDFVSECPVCEQSSLDQKHLLRKFASEDKVTKKREIIQHNTDISGMDKWNKNQGTFRNSEREPPTKRIQQNKTAVSLCGQCGLNKTDRVSKQCEEYYNSLQETKSRQRSKISEGCTYCQKQRNQDPHTEYKTRNISCNGCVVENCKHSTDVTTRGNSVKLSCKNQGYNSGDSSVGFLREIDRDMVHDSCSSDTFQCRHPYMDTWSSKQGVEPEIHRYASDSRGTIRSENQWSFPISQCTCNHHNGHYGHRRHITFAEDLKPQEGQCIGKLNPILHNDGIGFGPRENLMDSEPVFLSPSKLHADYLCRVKNKNSLPEIDDFLAHKNRPADSENQTHYQLSQTRDYYRHYPWPNVQIWENFLYKQRLRKRKKRALFMGVMAIGILVVIGIVVAMVLAVLRRKHPKVT